MTLTHDERFEYRGFHNCPSVCSLRVYEEDGQPPVALVTELEDNPGMSVTNMAEHLATAVWKMLERPALGLVWIEHYEDRAHIGDRVTLKEHFDRVTFAPVTDARGVLTRFGEPNWQQVTREDYSGPICQDSKTPFLKVDYVSLLSFVFSRSGWA